MIVKVMDVVTLSLEPTVPSVSCVSTVLNTLTSYDLECPICLIETPHKKEMPCCNNKLCESCYNDWHHNEQQPTCVFCRHASIEYVLDTTTNMSSLEQTQESEQTDNSSEMISQKCTMAWVFCIGYVVFMYSIVVFVLVLNEKKT